MDCFTGLDRLPSLESARFMLRPLENDDAKAVFAIFSDPDVTRYWGFSTFEHPAQAAAFIRQTHDGFASRRLLQWGIVPTDSEDVIGTAALFDWHEDHGRAEIGYALRRDQWGKGVASEVLPVVLRFAFEEMKLNRVEADVDPRNAASIRSLERAGFVREGYVRERYVVNGEKQDAIVYGLLRSDFERGGSG